MLKITKTKFRLFICIALIAYICAGVAWWNAQEISEHKSIVFDEAIQLQLNSVLLKSFKVNVKSKYRVELICRKRVDIKSLDKILVNNFHAEVSIFALGKPLQVEDTPKLLSISYETDSVGRFICDFSADAGVEYRMQIHIVDSSQALEQLETNLRIVEDARTFGQTHLKATIWHWLSNTLLVIGTFCWVVCIYDARKLRSGHKY